MATRGNGGKDYSGGAGIDDPRDIADAAADAVVEHEYWLQALYKAVLCGLPAGDPVLRDDAHLICRFGRWLHQHRIAGLLDGDLFDALEQAHLQIHRAGRGIALTAAAGPVDPADYDSFIVAVNGFRQVALEVESAHGGSPDESAADDGLAALEGRLTMLRELERERDRAVRTAAPLSLVLVRPQGFAELESEFGRVGADRAVIGLAARLFAQLRPYDAVYRYDRTEFLISLPNTGPDQALIVVRRLAEAIEESPVSLSDSGTVTLHARFGIAMADSRCPVQETLDRAVRAVDSIGADAAVDERVAVWSSAL